MNLVFRLSRKPDLKEAQRLSESLDRERGVLSALVDPQQAKVYVSFDPDLTGDLALQRLVEQEGHRILEGYEPEGYQPEGYESERAEGITPAGSARGEYESLPPPEAST